MPPLLPPNSLRSAPFPLPTSSLCLGCDLSHVLLWVRKAALIPSVCEGEDARKGPPPSSSINDLKGVRKYLPLIYIQQSGETLHACCNASKTKQQHTISVGCFSSYTKAPLHRLVLYCVTPTLRAMVAVLGFSRD